MRQKSDTTQIHNRLKAARRWRGYASATKAAEANGWAVGTYRVRESGIGGLSDALTRLYADGFGVSEEFLRTGRASTPNDASAAAFLGRDNRTINRQTPASVLRAAAALTSVRTARGYGSMLAAARTFGFTYTTYRTHELGIAAIPVRMAAVYACAFDVPTEAFDTSVEAFELSPEILARRSERTREDVEAFAASLDGGPASRVATVDVAVFEEPDKLLDAVRGGRRTALLGQTVVAISAWRIRGERASPLDFAVFRAETSRGAMEVLVRFDENGASSETGLRLVVSEASFRLLADDPDERGGRLRRKTKCASVALAVVSVTVSGSLAARLATLPGDIGGRGVRGGARELVRVESR